MNEGASSLVAVLLIAGAFGGGFLLLLFMLWASGRSPLVRVTGEVVATLLYLAMAMDAEGRLKLKPQNLLLNLPLARPQ